MMMIADLALYVIRLSSLSVITMLVPLLGGTELAFLSGSSPLPSVWRSLFEKLSPRTPRGQYSGQCNWLGCDLPLLLSFALLDPHFQIISQVVQASRPPGLGDWPLLKP
jgi:hypothetical protein